MLTCDVSLIGEMEHLLQTPIHHDDFDGSQEALKQLKLHIHISLGKTDGKKNWIISFHAINSNRTFADFRY